MRVTDIAANRIHVWCDDQTDIDGVWYEVPILYCACDEFTSNIRGPIMDPVMYLFLSKAREQVTVCCTVVDLSH